MSQLKIPSLHVLQNAVQGQCERNVVSGSRKQYLSLLKTISEVMNRHPHIRTKGLALTEEGDPQNYIGQAKNVFKFLLPLTPEAAQLTFANLSIDGNLAQKRRRTEDMDEVVQANEDEDEEEYRMNPAKRIATMSSQGYQNMKSAMKWWHTYHCPDMDKIGIPWLPETETVLKNAVHSYKRDTGQKKRSGIMKHQEGMMAFSLAGYIALCDFFNKMTPTGNKNTWSEGLFASSFLKMSVNTIGRSDNIDDMLLSCMDFVNDAIVLKFVTTKNDQEGEVHSELKRLFANPFNPDICVFLDLILYTFCKHRSSKDECLHLYGGRDQNKRYYTCLQKATHGGIPDFIDLGCARSDIGTHSNRKFAESTSASKVDGPSRTQVSLRAGQSVGKTQDCYMFAEEDGDAIVGRTVAQLKLNADEFDVLPPHFSLPICEKLEEYGWDNIYPGYQHHPVSFQRVIRSLFPSLVYHYHSGHLRERCSPQHPIWRQRIFTDRTLINSLKDEVIIVHGYCPQTNMSADGVPGFILISREIRNFEARYVSTCGLFNTEVIALKTMFADKLGELPGQICKILHEQFEVNGAVSITKDNIRDLILEILEAPDSTISQILNTQKDILNKISPPVVSDVVDVPLTVSDEVYAGEFHLWSDNDRSRRVPYNFSWPTQPAFVMWDLWFFGDKEERICPYRWISGRDDLRSIGCRSYRSRTGKIMQQLVDIAISEELIEGAADITIQNGSDIFDIAYPLLIDMLYGEKTPTRPEDIIITTLYNRYTTMIHNTNDT
jgi:hypothetical protein